MKRTAMGFTLIELLIAVAIVAILAAIAYPSYQDYVRRSRRQDAVATLLNLQLLQEKWRASNPAYTTTFTDLLPAGAPLDPHYAFTLVTGTPTTYTMRATANVGTSQVSDKGKQGSICTPLEVTPTTNTPGDCF